MPERTRLDVRTDDDVELILDWLELRLGYPRPRVIRVALWALASRLGMPGIPPLRRLLSVRPGRRPKVSRNGSRPGPTAAGER